MSFNIKSKADERSTVKSSAPSLSERINLYICPMLLGASICFSVIYELYERMAIPYTILFLVIEFFLFGFFDKLKSRKALGGLIYTVILIVLVFISIQLTRIGAMQAGDWRSPMLWFYGLEESDEKHPLFLNAIFIGGGFFIISILYYFTQVRYRTLGAMLCILFPFVIYSRRMTVMPELMATVIVMLYLAVVVHNRRTDPSQKQRYRTMLKIDRSYIISIVVFVTVTGTITMMIEKPMYLSKLERNSSYFDYALTGGASDAVGQSLDSVSTTSAPRYGARNYTGDPLFYLDTNGTEEVYYLRRQPYITFNGDVWEIDERTNRNRFFYTSVYPEYSTDDILNDMRRIIDENGIETEIPESCLEIKSGRVYSDSFTPLYLPAPFGIITDNVSTELIRYRKYPQNAIIRNLSYRNGDSTLNDSFEFYDQTGELYGYARQLGLNSEEYIDLLSEDDSDEAERLLEDYLSAHEIYSDKSNISDRIAELAVQITDGTYSDIEKAYALEQYFEQNGYVYDEDYNPEDESIDYFIFEGKTGVCTSYATAMTLMARSIGLPARYVEGFAAFEKSEENPDAFLIRDKHAHAFVEVYISGVGWLTFDPTVSGYMEVSEEESSDYSAALLRLLSRFLIVGIVALFIVFTWLRDRLIECAFRIRQLFRDPKQRTLKLYANLIKLINFSSNDDYSSYTVNMLRDYIVSTRGDAPEKLLRLFERTAFGGYNPTAEEYRDAYLEYKKCYKYLRKIPQLKGGLNQSES